MTKESGFSKLYWGFLFIMIDFRLQGIDVLPDIIGYIFFAAGFSILASRSGYFEKAGKLNIPMLLLSIFSIYEKPAQGVNVNMGDLNPIGLLIGIATLVLGLLVVYNLFMGVKELSTAKGCSEFYEEADRRWTQYLILQLASIFAFILIFIPPLAMIYILGILVAAIVYTIIVLGFMKRCGENLE